LAYLVSMTYSTIRIVLSVSVSESDRLNVILLNKILNSSLTVDFLCQYWYLLRLLQKKDKFIAFIR